ncbi:uncharacterized protein N7496_012231 [Penicillium cataractarum]|uniref:Rhodopsin domain-containing protein n=1 Tax=Penicillium cataractarum TaxID=2100454 RepID=A0A9W9R973_9EURO|nr:uncharacterized protein N7496_012231 [Penicillium cataractarum]KAJ5355019.1 hypothetical protein N7496_012231 [Penicillium cataractarum]
MGWVYNLHGEDPHSEISRVIAICLVFSISALLAIILRFYVRLSTNRTPWVDDYAALASSIFALAYAGIAVVQTRWGQGLSAAYFPKENVIPFSKVQYVGGPVYCLALLGFKVALLTSYLRIAGVVKLYRKVIIAAIVVCAINQLIFTVIISVSCIPVAKQWDSSIKGKCIDTIPFYFALAGTSIGLDLVIIALPLPVLWRLQLRLKQKVILAGLFALGFFVTVIQIIRIFTVKDLKTYTDSKNIVIWSCIEVSLGVIVSCIPTYGPLFKAFASTVNSYRNNDTSRSYQLGSIHPTTKSAASRKRSNFELISESEGAQITVVVSADGGRKNYRTQSHGGDSEEHILSPTGKI